MKKNTAIVIGASIAGLMAARALANHFAKVVVLERAPTPLPSADAKSSNARGVPQSDHTHVLLESGMAAIVHYFPGIIEEMQQSGAQRFPITLDWRWFQHGSWKVKARNGFITTTQHRRSLDQHIRRRLTMLPNLQFIDDCTVEGVLWDGGRDEITGISFVQKSGTRGHLPADLVVDASGKGSRMLSWLSAAPYEASERGVANPPWDKFPPAPIEILPIKLCYVSRIFEKPTKLPSWQALAISPLAQVPRGGVVMSIDDKHWIATLFGYCGEQPLTSSEAFLEFAKTLPAPDLYEALAQAKPVTDAVKFLYPHSQWQRLDQARKFPGGVLLIGDALCSLDPVFGQGMSLACKEARALDAALHAQNKQTLHKRYFKACQQIIAPAWEMTKTEALRFEKMPGVRSWLLRCTQWYTGYVFDLCSHHEKTYLALADVIHLKRGPESLLRPTIMARVLLNVITRRAQNK